MKRLLLSMLVVISLNGFSQNLIKTFDVEVSGYTDSYLNNIQNDFTKRTDSMFSAILANPYPSYSVPLQNSNAVALYLWNKENQAMAALSQDTLISTANAELRDALDTLMSHHDWLIAGDGFHWRSEIPGRLWELYRTDTTLLEIATKQKIEEIFLAWFQDELIPELSDITRIWTYYGSENHHIMRLYTAWQGTKILSEGPLKTTIINGFTIEQHYQKLNLYVQIFLKERNLKGGFIEHGSHTYAKYTLQCLYNFYDFGDQIIQKHAKALLDTWWADYGQENLDFIRGGAKNRIYQNQVEDFTRDGTYSMIWAYTGGGFSKSRHPSLACLYNSSYRLPTVVLDLILDNRSLGPYITLNSKAAKRITVPNPEPSWHYLDSQSDTVAHRITYISDHFVMGTHVLPYLPINKWALISSQNRWNSVIFSGDQNSRLFPLLSPKPNGNGKVYNSEYAFQHKGTMITRKIHDDFSINSGTEMRIFFSDDLVVEESALASKDDWIFVQATNAYAAVKGLHGSYSWDDNNYIRFARDTTPIIIEVVEKSDYSSYNEFKLAITSRVITDTSSVLSFQSISDGALIEFSYQRGGGLIATNGNPVNIYQKGNYLSKYIFGAWGDENLRINKSGRILKPVASGMVEPWIKTDFIQIYQDNQIGEIEFSYTNAAMYDFYAKTLDSTLIDTNSFTFTQLGGDRVRMKVNSVLEKTGLTKINVFAKEKSTGIEDQEFAQIIVYPNPFDQNLNLSLPIGLSSEIHITLLDNQGRSVFTKTLHSSHENIQLKLQNLPSGLYLLRVKTAEGKAGFIKKLVKR